MKPSYESLLSTCTALTVSTATAVAEALRGAAALALITRRLLLLKTGTLLVEVNFVTLF
jgi:hypothetical protein